MPLTVPIPKGVWEELKVESDKLFVKIDDSGRTVYEPMDRCPSVRRLADIALMRAFHAFLSDLV